MRIAAAVLLSIALASTAHAQSVAQWQLGAGSPTFPLQMRDKNGGWVTLGTVDSTTHTFAPSSTVLAPGAASANIGTLGGILSGTLPNPGFATPLNIRAATLSIGAPGIVGDGVANDTVALQAALTAAASGGEIRLPCGTYRFTATLAATIAAGAKLAIRGAGSECTRIIAAAAIDGLRFTFSSPLSSVIIEGLSLVSTTAGGNTGITLAQTAINTNPALSGTSMIRDVHIVGSEFNPPALGTKYWATGISVSGVSNVEYETVTYASVGGIGNGILIAGVSSSLYSVSHKIKSARLTNAATCIFYGDWVQGVWVTDSDIVGCAQGIATAASPAGELDQLFIHGNEFGYGTTDINIAGPITDVVISSNQIANEHGAGYSGVNISGAASQYVISGNTFFATSGVGSNAINLAASPARGPNLIVGNVFYNFQNGIGGAAFDLKVKISSNEFRNNTNDYSFATGASGVVVTDDTPRAVASLHVCTAGLDGSRFVVNNASAPTFLATVAGGGSARVVAMCNGATAAWQAH